MTKVEAIRILEPLISASRNEDFTEAVRLAIDALSCNGSQVGSDQRWRSRHTDPTLGEWPEDMKQILLTIKTYEPKGIEVVAGTYCEDEGWIIDYEDNYGEFDVLAWMPMPEPWKGEEK